MRGIRQGSTVVNVLTVGKLVPLALFIVIGLAYVEPARLTTLPPITLQQSLTAGLLLIFIYGGYEVVPVPAGESLDPRRDVPFAMVATIAVGDDRDDADPDRRAGRAARMSPTMRRRSPTRPRRFSAPPARC